MKIVCVCEGGNSRSVGMAYVLKARGHAAVPIGVDHAHSGLMQVLCDWAELIIPMTPQIAQRIPHEYHGKVKVCDVGANRYFLGYTQDLMKQCEAFSKKEGLG